MNILDFDEEVQTLLRQFGWPVRYNFKKRSLYKLADANEHTLFKEWFDYLFLFHDMVFELGETKYVSTPMAEINFPREEDEDDLKNIIGQNNLMIGNDSWGFSWLLGEDGKIYTIWSGMIFYEGSSLNAAFNNRMRSIEGEQIGNLNVEF